MDEYRHLTEEQKQGYIQEHFNRRLRETGHETENKRKISYKEFLTTAADGK